MHPLQKLFSFLQASRLVGDVLPGNSREFLRSGVQGLARLMKSCLRLPKASWALRLERSAGLGIVEQKRAEWEKFHSVTAIELASGSVDFE